MEYSERFQSNNDKINTKIYLLVKPRRDSNSQPRGYHGSMQLSYWACHFNQFKILRKTKRAYRGGGWTRTIDLLHLIQALLLLSYST